MKQCIESWPQLISKLSKNKFPMAERKQILSSLSWLLVPTPKYTCRDAAWIRPNKEGNKLALSCNLKCYIALLYLLLGFTFISSIHTSISHSHETSGTWHKKHTNMSPTVWVVGALPVPQVLLSPQRQEPGEFRFEIVWTKSHRNQKWWV